MTMHVSTDPRRSAGYRRLTRAIRQRDRYICQKCGEFGREVDHIVPLHQGGALTDPDNLQVLCRDCHIRKTERERPGRIPGRREWRERIREGL